MDSPFPQEASVLSEDVQYYVVERYPVELIAYFPAHRMHRPIRRTVIFSSAILEKKMMNVF
jgi:hypothetical protein